MSARPCHDMSHSPGERAPHCTKVANTKNIIECDPDLGEDMYFCDDCFKVGNDLLKKAIGLSESSDISLGEMMDMLELMDNPTKDN